MRKREREREKMRHRNRAKLYLYIRNIMQNHRPEPIRRSYLT